MLHELLFALSGHTGDVFVKDEANDIVVTKNLPFIHPTEESTLNKLCCLATCYIKLKSFVEETADFFCASAGLYATSFARGLELCLEPYQELIIELEDELLRDPHLTLAHIVAKTEEYQLVLPSLMGLAEDVAKKKVYGCGILDMLYKAAICGVPSVKEAVLKILQVCHETMYKQLGAWLLYGLLYNSNEMVEQAERPRDEFFICLDFKKDDKDCDKEKTKVSEPDEDFAKDGCPKFATKENFVIKVEMLPGHIPLRIAEKILFVGRSVVLFESSGRDARRRKDAHLRRAGSSIMKIKEDEFMNDLKKLSASETFDLIRFEDTVDKIRTYVAEQLWNLIVIQSDLQSHLKCFKDFFLIGRGELFLAFIDQSQNLLRNPPTNMTQHDVNLAFQHAARDVLLNEESFQRFKFIIEEPTPKDSKNKSLPPKKLAPPPSSAAATTFLSTRESGWNCLKMVALVDWPLHVMFTPGIIRKYSELFSFLLYVKRIQLELQQCWSIEMQRRHLSANKNIWPSEPTSSPGSPGMSSTTKWRLRNHMAFLVDNLQYYLQVDVIESQHSLLVNKIKMKKDFEEIMLAHDHFLTSLHNQCFLHSKQISNCLRGILELCHAFYGLMTYSESSLTQTQQSQLHEITKEFELQSGLLFMLLSSVRNSQPNSLHLAQLLLRIDYNKYFSHVQQPLGVQTQSKAL